MSPGALQARVERFRARLESAVPAALVELVGAETLTVTALPLLFDSAARDPRGGPEVVLRRNGTPDVLLIGATAAWRCPDAAVYGQGLLELVAWARDCSLLDAATWCCAVRLAAVRRGIR